MLNFLSYPSLNGEYKKQHKGGSMIECRILQEQEINRRLFRTFIRYQVVDQCLRRENGLWVVCSDPFIDDWTEEGYQTLISCLHNTVRTGGSVCGSLSDGELKGFVSVENDFFGVENRYHDLSSLHVSEDMRRNGIGKALFLAAEWAGKQGGRKAVYFRPFRHRNSSVLRSMGCTEAAEYNQKHVKAVPFDCQMEYVL